jgi:NTP pyrophosphatase (non-canonical NTP hydrolase)
MEEKKTEKKHFSPFGYYFNYLEAVDKDKREKEYGSILILSLIEEVGEMARAYLAQHGRKPTNLRAQQDESYQRELGDILVAIIRLAKYKNIDLHKKIMASLHKIRARKIKPKE